MIHSLALLAMGVLVILIPGIANFIQKKKEDKEKGKPKVYNILSFFSLLVGLILTSITGYDNITAKINTDLNATALAKRSDSLQLRINEKNDTIRKFQIDQLDSTRSIIKQGNKLIIGLDTAVAFERQNNGTSLSILRKNKTISETLKIDSIKRHVRDSISLLASFEQIKMIIYEKKYEFENRLANKNFTFTHIDSSEVKNYFISSGTKIFKLLRSEKGNYFLIENKGVDTAWNNFVNPCRKFFWNFTGYAFRDSIPGVLQYFEDQTNIFERQMNSALVDILPKPHS